MVLTMEGVITIDGDIVRLSAQTVLVVKDKESELGFKIRYMSKVEGIVEGGQCALIFSERQGVRTVELGGKGESRRSVSQLLPEYFHNISYQLLLLMFMGGLFVVNGREGGAIINQSSVGFWLATYG
eukprot:GHVS01023468.1.p1 GENE.GHVS01023468.1~~GHVS01023468.1.p1  ORF type:complete len:127 (+),score=11.51 GHVS01023468.1:138-518(+)